MFVWDGVLTLVSLRSRVKFVSVGEMVVVNVSQSRGEWMFLPRVNGSGRWYEEAKLEW